MDMRIPPLKIKIMLESKPSEIQNLSTEIGRMATDRVRASRAAAKAPTKDYIYIYIEREREKDRHTIIYVSYYIDHTI